MTLKSWSDLNVGDLCSFQSDPAGNVYLKCSSQSMCLLKDNGGTPDLSDRDNAMVWLLGNAADSLP